MKINFGCCILLVFWFINVESKCNKKDKTLNCSNSDLLDCPPFVNEIDTLILDYNNISSLSSTNCSKFKEVIELSICWNKLTEVDTSLFPKLNIINASNNEIKKVLLINPTLQKASFRNNSITFISCNNSKYITDIDISFNSLKLEQISKLFDCIGHGRIETLDISYNELTSTSTKWLSFNPQTLKSINLSGNEFKMFNFENMPKHKNAKKTGYKLDISNNKINSWLLSSEFYISLLDLSSNNISTVNYESFETIISLNSLDLSNNPLLCECDNYEKFINWVQQNKKVFINTKNTICSDTKTELLNMTCIETTTIASTTTGKSTNTTTTTTTTKSVTTSNQLTTTKSTILPITTKYPTKSHAGLISGIIILCLIIVAVIIFFLYKKRNINCRLFLNYARKLRHSRNYGSPSETDPLIDSMNNDPIDNKNKITFLCCQKASNEVNLRLICKLKMSSKHLFIEQINLKQFKWVSSNLFQKYNNRSIVLLLKDDYCYNDSNLKWNLEYMIKNGLRDHIHLVFMQQPDPDDFNGKRGLFFEYINEEYKKDHYLVLDFRSDNYLDELLNFINPIHFNI